MTRLIDLPPDVCVNVGSGRSPSFISVELTPKASRMVLSSCGVNGTPSSKKRDAPASTLQSDDAKNHSLSEREPASKPSSSSAFEVTGQWRKHNSRFDTSLDIRDHEGQEAHTLSLLGAMSGIMFGDLTAFRLVPPLCGGFPRSDPLSRRQGVAGVAQEASPRGTALITSVPDEEVNWVTVHPPDPLGSPNL